MNDPINRRQFLKGMGATFPLVALQMYSAGRALQEISSFATDAKPNILILVFDTLSAVHLSFHDYARQTAPNLSRFAERANVYHNHYAGGNFTSSGTASLLTATYPWTHRALHLNSTIVEDQAQHNMFSAFDNDYFKIAYTHNPLAADLLHQFQGGIDQLKPMHELLLRDSMLAERLFPNDYTISNQAEKRIWGHQPGRASSLALSIADRIGRFEVQGRQLKREYEDLFPLGLPNFAGQYFKLEDVVDWLATTLHTLPQPFLAYVHVLPPHSPYMTRKEFYDLFAGDNLNPVEKPLHYSETNKNQKRMNEARQWYDEFILYTDAEFGRLMDQLGQGALLNNTITMVTSDHGEMFERGIWGHITPALYEPIIRVPLLIQQPRQTEKLDFRVPTSCVDVLPTLLHRTGQTIPDWCEGTVLPGFGGDEMEQDRSVFSLYAMENPKLGPLEKATFAMVKGDYKLIYNRGQIPEVESFELYNLADDPQELVNLYQTKRDIASSFREELEAKLFTVGATA